MRFVFYMFLILLQVSVVFAQEDTTNIIETQTFERTTIDLTGKWDVSYNDGDTWEEKYIPSVETGLYSALFKKTIKLSSNNIKNSSLHLNLEGISDNAEFYVNEQFIGNYFGGLTPFQVDIPEKILKPGDNELKIKVDPPGGYAHQIQKFPLHSQKIYSGIIRKIELVSTSKAWVNSIKSDYKLTNDLNRAAVTIETNISTGNLSEALEDDNVTIQASIFNGEGSNLSFDSKQINIKSSRLFEVEFKGVLEGVKLWTPDEPNSYIVSVRIYKNGSLQDELVKTIGFRQIDIAVSENSNTFILNGKEFSLKSVNYIVDYSGYGTSVPLNKFKEDLEDIKRLGANTIRVKYNILSPEMLKICEEEGIFILFDLPVYNVPSDILASDEVTVRVKNILDRVLTFYDLSPAVFSYGTYSYSDESDSKTTKYSNEITELIRNSSNKLIHKSIFLNSSTVIKENYDFLIAGIYERIDDFNLVAERFKKIKQLSGSLPVIAEFGVPISPDNKSGYGDKLSLEYQAHYLLTANTTFLTNGAAGVIVDSYNDYQLSLPLMTTNSKDKYVYTSGLVNRERDSRISFKAVKAIFNKEKEPLLTAESGEENNVSIVFIVSGIFFSIIFLTLINRFRRFREYFFRSIFRPYNFYADIRDQRLVSTVQTSVLSIICAVSVAAFLSAIFYHLRYSSSLEYFFNIIIPVKVIKENLFSLIWEPILLILVLSIVFILAILLVAFFLRIVAFLLSVKLIYRDAFTIVVWSSIPIIILLPISIFLLKILDTYPGSLYSAIILLGVIKVWDIFRFFKSSAVVFDKPASKVYLTEFATLFVIMGIPLLYLQFNRSIFDYVLYIFNVML